MSFSLFILPQRGIQVIFFCFICLGMFRSCCFRITSFYCFQTTLYVVECIITLSSTHLFLLSVQMEPVPLGPLFIHVQVGLWFWWSCFLQVQMVPVTPVITDVGGGWIREDACSLGLPQMGVGHRMCPWGLWPREQGCPIGSFSECVQVGCVTPIVSDAEGMVGGRRGAAHSFER